MKTKLCQMLGIEHPIIAAPMGPDLTGPDLVAAVSNAGGLGILQAQFRSPPVFRREIRRVRALTAKPFGVNLLLHFPVEDRVAICLEERVPVLSLFWGDPTPYVGRAHAAGVKVFHQVGSVANARRAAAAGVDVIIAQGVEAGGHVAGEVSTLALVPRVVDAVAPRPVVAAGGIADARGVVAVLALGAQAAMLGTRFLASAESRAHPPTNRGCWRRTRAVRSEPFCSATAGQTPRTGRCGPPLWSNGSGRRPAARNRARTSRRWARR
jgi:nitronate monooxygenase